jgi:lysylphosphatidylglycerol synthetase-like protein (DUF2156 family)
VLLATLLQMGYHVLYATTYQAAFDTVQVDMRVYHNFRGLHQFKARFGPEWSPRFLVYPGATSLPAVTMALVRADSGDDLVESFGRSLVPKRQPAEQAA